MTGTGHTLRTRLAPTPSGYLHAGNAINFLITHQLAHAQGGRILLRIDDLDTERARPEYVQDVFGSLRWLGITWGEGPRDAEDFNEHWSQTLRIDRSLGLAEALRERGHLYACTCSRKQIDACDCRGKNLPFDAADTAWRLAIPSPCPVVLKSWPSGEQHLDLHALMRDPVVRQRNGSPAYQLASLADDVDFRMDLIVRGEDLLPSSACQTHIASLLGLDQFLGLRFLHHPLVSDDRGQKLSKSAGAGSLHAMRIAGEDPQRLLVLAERTLAALLDQGV